MLNFGIPQVVVILLQGSLVEMDVESAYSVVPVHPDNYLLFGMV